jgi:lysozyme family protein
MMTQRFLHFLPFVIEHEGRTWEDDKDDPGNFTPAGELKGTKFGIDARSHPNVDIKNLTEQQAGEIYFTQYWQKNNCQGMPEKLGESHFDSCVNTGSGRAAKFLAASNGDAKKYNNEREAFYHRLVSARPKSQKYLRGWLNRVNDLRSFLHIT